GDGEAGNDVSAGAAAGNEDPQCPEWKGRGR
ncbi:MAG: hypothetical protein QOJ51_4060, partial [Acidobacteriaceae bacterium]|nr:hypothetical protein [Acidobacteriaceae bacterium]